MLAKLPKSESAPDVADEAIRHVDAERKAAKIAACVRTLRRPEQDVVALCDMSGLSYAEAATALGIPIGTVRSRLSRARERLRPMLAELDEPGHSPSIPSAGCVAGAPRSTSTSRGDQP